MAPRMADWEKYEAELHKKNQGLPLWIPEPHHDIEVQVGTVGYMHEGQFKPVINIITGEAYDNWTLPEDFEAFPLPPQLKHQVLEYFPKNHAESSIQVKVDKVSADAQAGDFVNLSLTIARKKEKAAFLFLPQGAKKDSVAPTSRLSAYMIKSIEKWYNVMFDILGTEIEREKILLVRGTVKTPQWGVAVVSAASFRHGASLSAGFGPAGVAGGGMSFSIERLTGASMGQRWSKEGHTDPNQCVLLSYYKLKRRMILPDKIVAGAGDHDIVSDRDDHNDDGGVGVGSGQPDQAPVDDLLDYILTHPGVDVAIATDEVLVEISNGEPVPDDVSLFLREVRPEVSVEDGVGSISIPYLIQRAFAHRDGENDATQTQGATENTENPVAGPSHTTQEEMAIDDPEPSEGQEAESTEGQDPGLPPPPNPRSKPKVSQSATVQGTLTTGAGVSLDWLHKQLLDQDQASHNAAIASFDVSPDGAFVGVGFEDGKVRIWNSDRWRLVYRMEAHEESVSSIKFSPQGNRFVSADFVGIVWELVQGNNRYDYNEVTRLLDHAHGDLIWDLDWSPDSKYIATGSSDNKVRLFDAENGQLVNTFGGVESLVSHIRFSKDNKRLVCVAENTGHIWDYHTGSFVGSMTGHSANIWSVAFSPDSNRFITGSEDNTARIWDMESGAELVTLREHTGPVWAVGFSPDGKETMTGSYDSTLVICNSYTGERRLQLATRQSVITSAAYSPRGNLVVSGSADGTVWLWDTKDGEKIGMLQGHEDHVKNVAFTPQDDAIVSASDDGTARVWRLVDILRVQ